MSTRDKNLYCCCKMFPIVWGAYFIAFHCFLQGTYGICLVVTTTYKSPNAAVNYITCASFTCLFPTGFVIFLGCLYESWKCTTLGSFLIVTTTLFNVVTSIVYYIHYSNFKANSVLDQDFFWKDSNDWVHSKDFPFTIWHILSFFLFFPSFVWWYYAHVMCQLSRMFKGKSESKSTRTLASTPASQNVRT